MTILYSNGHDKEIIHQHGDDDTATDMIDHFIRFLLAKGYPEDSVNEAIIEIAVEIEHDKSRED